MLKRDRSTTNLLLFSLVIGLLLRLFFLFQRDFWFDEAFTFFIARLPIDQIPPAVLTDNNPPFYYLVMHFVVKFSESPIILRLPSFLFNIGSAYFLYKVVAKLLNKKVATYAITFFSLSPLTIYLATTARLHALGLFFVTAILFTFIKLIDTPTRPRKVFFFIISLLGVYTHYYVALLFIPLSVWVFTHHAYSIKKSWFLLSLFLFGSFVPWVIVQATLEPAICSCPPTHLSLPATLVSPFLGGIGEVTVRRYDELPLPLLLFLGGGAAFSVYLFYKGLKKNQLLTYLYIIPLILISISGIVTPTFSPKGFSIYSSIFFTLIATYVVTLKNSKWTTVIIILFLLAVNIIQITNPFFSGTPISPIVEITKLNSNTSIAHVSSITYYSTVFYLPNHPQFLLTTNPYPERTVHYIGGKQSSEMKENLYWLVDTNNWVSVKERESQLTHMYTNFEIIKEFSLPEVSIKLIERK